MDTADKFKETLEALEACAQNDPLELTEGLLPALSQQCTCIDIAKNRGTPVRVPGCKHPVWLEKKTEKDNPEGMPKWTILPEKGSSTLFRAVLHTCGQGEALENKEWARRILLTADAINSRGSLEILAEIILQATTTEPTLVHT